MNERRHFPRYTCEIEFRVKNTSEQDYRVQANDISEAGISLVVSQSTITGLANNGLSLEIGSKFQLMPCDGSESSPRAVTLKCQIMHVRRLSQEHYLIGAWFNASNPDEQADINSLLGKARHTTED